MTEFIVEDPLASDPSHPFGELEAPGHRSFRAGETRPMSPMAHALPQVRDWRTWL